MSHKFEKQFETYLQGHFHPDIAPDIRREVKLGHVSIESFLRLADIFQANHEALDADALAGEIDTSYQPQLFTPQLEVTETSQQYFNQRFNEVR